MENAVDALKLGAAVIIFVLALSISITAFSEVRVASTVLLDYRDREAGLGESDYYHAESTERTVGLETIIPSLYRVKAENYKVVFKFSDSDYFLYKKKNTELGESSKPINTIEFKNDESYFDEIVRIVLYGKVRSGIDDRKIETIENNYEFNDDINCLYNKIKDKKFKEYSGIYIPSEAETGKSNAPDANKTTKRVITYEEI